MPVPLPRKPKPLLSVPVVRLACSDGQAERNGTLDKQHPTVRLAHKKDGQGDNCLLGIKGVPQLPRDSWPALLVSYYYLGGFLQRQDKYAYRDWAMDSGAFSAYNNGTPIDLYEYMQCCHETKDSDPSLVEIIALDVIGDGEGSLKNAYTMRENGLDVMPVFHIGDDWQILLEYARVWDKVGLSCRFGEPIKDSMRFYEQCFARVWPKKCHSFGWQGEKMLMTFPFHSSDSADWEVKPCQFGTWRSFGKPGSTAYLNYRGSQQNLRAEVEWYLKLERRLREKWADEMALLERESLKSEPDGRLAVDANSGRGERLLGAIGKPDVRLSVGAEGSRKRAETTFAAENGPNEPEP